MRALDTIDPFAATLPPGRGHAGRRGERRVLQGEDRAYSWNLLALFVYPGEVGFDGHRPRSPIVEFYEPAKLASPRELNDARFAALFGSRRGTKRPQDEEAEHYRALRARHGALSERQRSTLEVLCFSIGPALSIETVAQRTGTTRQGATRTLRSLERRGLVQLTQRKWQANEVGRELLIAHGELDR